MPTRHYPLTRRASGSLVLIAISAAGVWGQTPSATAASLIGQDLILAHIGEQPRVRLKKSHTRIAGNCDLAVVVQDAGWKSGTARFTLQTIGMPSAADQHNKCRIPQDAIDLEITGFAPDEPADALLASVHQVLQTPEEYLAAAGVPFSIPPGDDDETPVKPPPTITVPKVLLRVEGAYTPLARRVRQKGDVRVSLIVGTDGRVHHVRIVRQLGYGLDENALRALRMWRFEPARQEDKQVAVESSINMHFDIR